jgi:hypothetical protein
MYNRILRKLYLTFIFAAISLGSGCTWFTYKVGEQMSFPNSKYTSFISNIYGKSYGWKFICFFPLATPNYGKALEDLWKNSEIPMSERKYYKIVNMEENWGTSWTILLIGQNYLTVTGDIVENKSKKRSPYNQKK